MTRAEELADKYGITEVHDENCHGDGLCRQHFIEKLEEAFKKQDSGEYSSVGVIAERLGDPTANPTPQSVAVWATCREEGKPEPVRIYVFERRKPGSLRDPATEAMFKARWRELLAKHNIRMA